MRRGSISLHNALDDVKGETVVIYLLSDPQAQLEEFGAKAQEVIDTIEWTGE